MGKNTWDVALNDKNGRWYLEVTEADLQESYPSADEVIAACTAKGINLFSLIPRETMEKKINAGPELDEKAYSFPITIEPTFDTRIIISPDKTSAQLYIRKSAADPTTIDLKLISALINKSRLAKLDIEAVKKRILDFRTAANMELSGFIIAEGKPPLRGKDRTLKAEAEWFETKEHQFFCATLQKRNPAEWAILQKEFKDCSIAHMARVIKGEQVYALSTVERGESGLDVYGAEIPGLPGNDPYIKLLGNLSLSPAGVTAETDGILFAVEEGSGIKAKVIPYRDGSAQVRISKDQFEAVLELESELGSGEPLSMETINTALTAAGVKLLTDKAVIEGAIRDARTTRSRVEILAAEGIQPVPPGGCRIKWDVKPRGTPPSAIVFAGQQICSWSILANGENGQDVLGNAVLPANNQSKGELATDNTIEISKGPGEITLLTALVSGELVRNGNNLTVSGTKEIKHDIDDKTGDIHFPGNLNITGIVRKDHKAVSRMTLKVTGEAEAALLSADESVYVEGGIRGAARGTVWAKQKIFLNFAENARLLAGGDIFVDNYCFQCTVKTNGKLVMQGSPGVLLGGMIHASQGVEVLELGAEKKLRTSISFGQNYLIRDQIEVCEKERDKNRQQAEALDALMAKTDKNDPRIHEMRKRKLELLKQNDKLALRVFTLKERFEAHIMSHIRVEHTVYPGVILESHGRYYEVKQKMSHVIFRFDQITGQIICSQIEG